MSTQLRPRLRILSIVLLLASLIGGCGQSPPQSAAIATASPAPAPTLEPEQQVDTGDFKARYPRVENKDFLAIQKDLKKEKVLEGLAAALNETFALPKNITLAFDQCDEANAYYEPDSRTVTMCYELVEYY